jgi:predicted dehydrogenase
MNILIFGAGSIGNHMAFAALKNNFKVYVTDVRESALMRMKKEIFPKRYGKWSKKIILVNYDKVFNLATNFDIIVIGTPPLSHLSIFKECTKKFNFKKLLIEKPLTSYNDKKIKKFKEVSSKKLIFCGYNHSISNAFIKLSEIIEKEFKSFDKIECNWCEGWQGILKAHFWLKNEFKSYLGDYKQGGGALQEHSHGIHLLYLILRKNFKINLSKLKLKTFVNKKYKKNLSYDNFSVLFANINNKLITYKTDLITYPAEKIIKIYYKNKFLKLTFNYKQNLDRVSFINNSKIMNFDYKKTRSSEFENELKHIKNINNKLKYNNSNLNVNYAVDIVKIFKKIFIS